MDVGHHCCFGNARVDDDESTWLCSGRSTVNALAENRVVVCDIRADQNDDIGRFHIGVRAGWTVGSERQLVAGDSRGHAERGVAIMVASAEAKLDELAKCVELFSDELPGADDT